MKRVALHFSRLYKALLLGVLGTSWLTGTAWFSLHRWIRIAGEFGEEHSPWEPLLLKIHGGSAMLMMIYYGYLLGTHVPVGLGSRRNRVLGLALVYSIGFLIVTSYGLYYLGGEDFRVLVSWSHFIAGLLLPFILALHIWSGHRESR